MRFRAFSRQQRRGLTWWCSAEGQSREAVICDGAVRSGKTLCMGLAFFLWATACFDGMAFGLCGKTITALRRNLLREVLPTLGALGFQWREQASQNRLTVRLGGKENTFYLFGGRDEGSAALIQGITLAGFCWMRRPSCPAPSWSRPALGAPCRGAGCGSPATRSTRSTGFTRSGF